MSGGLGASRGRAAGVRGGGVTPGAGARLVLQVRPLALRPAEAQHGVERGEALRALLVERPGAEERARGGLQGVGRGRSLFRNVSRKRRKGDRLLERRVREEGGWRQRAHPELPTRIGAPLRRLPRAVLPLLAPRIPKHLRVFLLLLMKRRVVVFADVV